MSCAKCHQAPPEAGDTWCAACSAWEALASELAAPWHSRALRHLVTDQVEGLVRSVRALRNFSSSLKSAEASRAADRGRSDRPGPSAPRQAPPPPPPPPPVKEQPESSSGYESPSGEEEEERAPAATAAKSKPSRPDREAGEAEREEEKKPSPTRPRSPPGPPPREASVEREDRREGEKKKKKKDKDRTRRGNRAGRNHQRLYRALENPDQPLHRKRPASYWDEHHSLGHRASERQDRR